MAQHRVKANPKRHSTIMGAGLTSDNTPAEGALIEWDGKTLDDDGDIKINFLTYVAPQFVELVVEEPEPKAALITEEVIEKKVVGVRLVLPESAAQAIAEVFFRVGGQRYDDRREVIDALESVDIHPTDEGASGNLYLA